MANFRYQLYYGAALLRIMLDSRCAGVRDYSDDDNSTFVAWDSVRENGIYIKYCEKRISPWAFTFTPSHLEKLKEIDLKYERIYLLLVCYDHGVCCLNKGDIARLFRGNGTKSISVSRRTGRKYTVKATDGELKYKIGENDFPDKIFNPYQYEK